jgi:tetratricopeptide (TPR) repeat protein
MNRILLTWLFLGLVNLCCQAEGISLLYRQYLTQQGKAQVETGNMLLADAYQQGLIDSIGPFLTLTDEMEAWVHYSSASWAWEQGDLDHIAEPAKKALDYAIALENPSLQGDCYHLLGAEAQMKGNVYQAIEYFEKCYEADKQLNDPDRMSSSLNNLAGNYLSTDQADEAETYILKAIELERTMNRPEKLAIRLGMASDIYLKQGKPQAALPYITEAYELDSIGNRPMKMAVRLSQRASVYEALKRNDDARRCLLQALAIFAGTTNVRSTAICYNQLGNLALAEGKNYQAEEYFTHAVELSRSCQDRLAESKACKGLAVVLKDKQPALALDYLMRYTELTDTIFSEKMAQKLSSSRRSMTMRKKSIRQN